MKVSQYTSIFPLENKTTLLYNAVSDKFVVIPQHIKTLSSLSCENNQFYDTLVKANILVEDTCDEVSIVKSRFEEIDKGDSSFHLHINPTLNCNFSCWYCYENHNGIKIMSETVLESILKYCRRIISTGKYDVFNLSFFGGEPMISFDKIAKILIREVDAMCTDANTKLSVSFTTNGYLITEEIIKFLSQYECGFQITLDGGRNFHNKVRVSAKGDSYDVILKNIVELARFGNRVVARINYTPESIGSIPSVIADLNQIEKKYRHNVHINLQQVWQSIEGVGKTISDEISACISLANKEGFNCSSPLPANALYDSCYGDKLNHILINFDGSLYFCTARDFTKENSVGFLGEDGELNWIKSKYAAWRDAKFSNDFCHSCRIAPICGGGCKQNNLDRRRDGCLFKYSSEDIDSLILSRFERSFILK